jgi:uncharacterized protein
VLPGEIGGEGDAVVAAEAASRPRASSNGGGASPVQAVPTHTVAAAVATTTDFARVGKRTAASYRIGPPPGAASIATSHRPALVLPIAEVMPKPPTASPPPKTPASPPTPDELARLLRADEVTTCLTCAESLSLTGSPPPIDDAEGERVAEGLPEIIDSHVHLFPDGVFEAIWRWFDQHGWPIRYKLKTPAVIDFLASRGVSHIVALHYAHKPGLARFLNQYAAEIAREHPFVTAVATVLPGEPDARAILEEGFALGLRGVKLHCHVQAFAPDARPLTEIYEACVAHDLPLVMHAGREPSSAAYPIDTRAICAAERVDHVLREHPKLRLVVPHLGADEFSDYAALLERHENLYLDTTMMLADYFPVMNPLDMLRVRPERILYGTDFPNIPYAWDREMKHLGAAGLSPARLSGIFADNARRVFGIPERSSPASVETTP